MLTSLEERDKTISAQSHRGIERARYDVCDLAKRRYEQANLSKRLVARSRNGCKESMQRLLELEAELADFERQTVFSITAEQKQQILQLGTDFARLWKAPTTAASDRKRMLRLLISDITVVKGPTQSCCDYKSVGRVARPKQSRCVNHQTAPMQLVIPKHSSLRGPRRTAR